MTAGGGWLSPDGKTGMAGLRFLPVRPWDAVFQIERCAGTCCSRIALGVGMGLSGGLNPDELRAMGEASERRQVWEDRDGQLRYPVDGGKLISDMFEHIGFTPSHLGNHMHYYKCRFQCVASGNCEIYGSRPSMCSTHGMDGLCDSLGCTMRVQVNPLVLREPVA